VTPELLQPARQKHAGMKRMRPAARVASVEPAVVSAPVPPRNRRKGTPMRAAT
jgi:hypothetical protein